MANRDRKRGNDPAEPSTGPPPSPAWEQLTSFDDRSAKSGLVELGKVLGD
jgi:hypothetical protein